MLKEKVARAIRQLKKGKTEYFDEIYDLTKASVYYVIRGVLKDNYLVEDAMQETYVAFLNSIAKIDDEQNPLSYLLQIAKNKALDEARRMTRAAGANIDDVEIATSDVTVSDLPLLEHARQNLSDDEFRILELTTIYGYRRVEVAKMLGEPISTINWKYNKVIKKVKTFYGEVYNENKNKIINELYEKSPDVRERIKKTSIFRSLKRRTRPPQNRQTGSSGRRQSCPLRLSR